MVGLAIVALLAAAVLLTWERGLPLRLVRHYSIDELTDTARTMDECAECHEGVDFHSCSTCHDDHGAVEFADLPFYNMILFTGDVPRPGYVEVNEILPYRDHPATHVLLQEFLEQQGADAYESVTLVSRDGGFVTIERENLTDQAMLLPYADGIRFASEDLHVSTWLKGISTVVIVGQERDLILNGEPTSIGRLLLGATREVTVESAKVMFASETDGEVREAYTASRVWGAAVADLTGGYGSSVEVSTRDGEVHRLSSEDAAGAVLIPGVQGPVLVLPENSRSGWISGVSGITWEGS